DFAGHFPVAALRALMMGHESERVALRLLLEAKRSDEDCRICSSKPSFEAERPGAQRPPHTIDLPAVVESGGAAIPHPRPQHDCPGTARYPVIKRRPAPDEEPPVVLIEKAWNELRPEPEVQVVPEMPAGVTVVVQLHGVDLSPFRSLPKRD